jgi:hypothetical protein
LVVGMVVVPMLMPPTEKVEYDTSCGWTLKAA